jgi:hypothetical protein
VNDPHQKLLELAAFKTADIERILPKWKRTARALSVTDDDVRFAIDEWLPKQWDLHFFGVRKMLGVLLGEMISIYHAHRNKSKAETLIFTVLPFPAAIPLAMKMAAPNRVTITAPDILLSTVLGAAFHKQLPLLEKTENQGLTPTGCRNCALNKTRTTVQLKNILPPPDITWVAGLLCDEGPKTEEFIHCLGQTFGHSIICRLPHDLHADAGEDQLAERGAYLSQQIEHNLRQLKKLTGIKIRKAHLANASTRWCRYAYKYALLASITANSDPPPVSGFETTLFSLPLVMPFNGGLDAVEDALDSFIVEAQQRRQLGRGVVTKGTPRLMVYQMPFALPWLYRLFEQGGAALIGSLTTMMGRIGSAPLRIDDPLRLICDGWVRNPSICGTAHEVEAICHLMQHYRPDGLVMGLFDFDRWLGTHQRLVANTVQERIDRPVYYLEGDLWDKREYDRENLRTRVETICQMANTWKQMGTPCCNDKANLAEDKQYD